MITSNDKFAALLEQYGAVPPRKISPSYIKKMNDAGRSSKADSGLKYVTKVSFIASCRKKNPSGSRSTEGRIMKPSVSATTGTASKPRGTEQEAANNQNTHATAVERRPATFGPQGRTSVWNPSSVNTARSNVAST